MTWDAKACEAKKKYFKKDAIAMRNLRSASQYRPERGITVYHCPMCNWWHLTSVRARRIAMGGKINWKKWR